MGYVRPGKKEGESRISPARRDWGRWVEHTNAVGRRTEWKPNQRPPRSLGPSPDAVVSLKWLNLSATSKRFYRSDLDRRPPPCHRVTNVPRRG